MTTTHASAERRISEVPPAPLCNLPPLAIPPPFPGDRHFHVFLVNMYCAGLCCPSAYTWPCIAFPLLKIKHLCVFCDILSPNTLYGFVVLLFQTQDVEDQFCEWLLPILEKTSDKEPVPLQPPPPPPGDRHLATPPPPGRASC